MLKKFGGGLSRRDVLIGGAGILGGYGVSELARYRWGGSPVESLVVNDIHSMLNETTVRRIEHPTSVEDLIGVIRRSGRGGESICVAGSRHAMGGQQFGRDSVLIDTRSMSQVIDFDRDRGLIDVEVGIEWPELLAYLLEAQGHALDAWTIPSKQTGADRLSIGGAISANVHGRTLTEGPFIRNIESILVILADGTPMRCSRRDNPELFSLVVGGYGLFGVIHSVVLRLPKRQVIQRRVEVISANGLAEAFGDRIRDGYTLGDFQYVTDEKSDDFLQRGVFSCYKPVALDTPIPGNQKKVSERVWSELVYLAHTDKSRAFKLYSEFYLKTDGQVYLSDESQMGAYVGDYHQKIDKRMWSDSAGSEMITEVSVPRERVEDFLRACAAMLREEEASVIYGTIRLVEPENESFLSWAKGRFACVIFNLHVDHSKEGIERAAVAFRRLIDLTLDRGGSYYLTYHRWATKEQVLRCYPQFPRFLELKRKYDPGEVFQSEWYRHYRAMFG